MRIFQSMQCSQQFRSPLAVEIGRAIEHPTKVREHLRNGIIVQAGQGPQRRPSGSAIAKRLGDLDYRLSIIASTAGKKNLASLQASLQAKACCPFKNEPA